MADYTDINIYLDKAKRNIHEALLITETMEDKIGTVDDYQTLISDLNRIIKIIDKCEMDSEYVTDVFEFAMK